jgi:hypothetical protein
VIRYLHNVGFDSNVYSLNAGVDWNVTSRCSGTLGVALSKSPSALTQSLVATGINYAKTTAFNETGRCDVSNRYSLLFNTGWNEITNSNPIDALNNSRGTTLSAGIEYQEGVSTVTALASNSDTIRTIGPLPVPTVVGLSPVTDFHSFTLAYTRQINPNLSVNGLIGLVGTTTAFTLGLPRTLLPIYTLGMSWSFTPKLALRASAAKTISPPSTIIANAQTDYTGQMTLTYQLTPKVSVNAGGSISYTTSAFTGPTAVTGLASILTANSNNYSVQAGLTYTLTPFLSAGLNASYTERVTPGFITPQDVVAVSLNYRPY